MTIKVRALNAIRDQINFIERHDYAGYDRPESQSNRSVAVMTSDAIRLLDLADAAEHIVAAVKAVA
ncbi:MAG: hypothetical protein IIC03_04785 [Proteobacteria bacterium]|nr:hypothetical protein [Pseudomonadota bacterium]